MSANRRKLVHKVPEGVVVFAPARYERLPLHRRQHPAVMIPIQRTAQAVYPKPPAPPQAPQSILPAAPGVAPAMKATAPESHSSIGISGTR